MASLLSPYKTICIKIGSALLVDPATGLRTAWLQSLCADVAALKQAGHHIIIVSSGAIAMGRTVLNLPPRALKLEESQAAAAVGQIALAHDWKAALGDHAITTGQVLLTLDDTEDRRRYLNARATIGTLLKMGAVPVINENDTVATSEIRYGDNDRLAARVSTMMGADLLVLLSDIDGLYTAPPARDPGARLIPHVAEITPDIEQRAGGAASHLSRGGMRTKIDAAKIATRAGTAMMITRGTPDHPISRLAEGALHTLFSPAPTPDSAWRNWIAGQLETSGTITIDDGAHKALKKGGSLLPAGVRAVSGRFDRGDTISIALQGADGEIARGLAAYNSDEAAMIIGMKSDAIEAILGYAPRSAMVHRDDLVLTQSKK